LTAPTAVFVPRVAHGTMRSTLTAPTAVFVPRVAHGTMRSTLTAPTAVFVPRDRGSPAQSRIAGNSTTSRIERTPVSTITSRSIPIPIPPVGGIPCSSACTNTSS
jgi:hypothetical protein